MKTKGLIAAIGMTMAVLLTGNAQENEKRFGLELSGGASLATSKLADAKLNPGFGFEGILHYRFYLIQGSMLDGVGTGWGPTSHSPVTMYVSRKPGTCLVYSSSTL